MTSTGNIVFAIDGTLTDFNAYMKRYAVPYFSKKYGMKVVDPNALEIEDIFDMKNFFHRKHIVDAEQKVKKVIFRYWCSYRFLYYALCVPFREGIRRLVRELRRNGYHISIHTSRFAASRKERYGETVRLITYFQFWTKGIFISPHGFFFYDNDIKKIRALINFSPDLVFDDKNQIIEVH